MCVCTLALEREGGLIICDLEHIASSDGPYGKFL